VPSGLRSGLRSTNSHLRDRFHNIRRWHNLSRIVKYLPFRRFGLRPSACRAVPRYCFCNVRERENRLRAKTDWPAGPIPRKHLTCDCCSAWDWPRAGQVLASWPIRGRQSVASVTEILLAPVPDSKPGTPPNMKTPETIRREDGSPATSESVPSDSSQLTNHRHRH
jgi:hypothetical protein